MLRLKSVLLRLPAIIKRVVYESGFMRLVRYRYLYNGQINYKANILCTKDSHIEIGRKSWIGAYTEIVLQAQSILAIGACSSIGRYCEIGGHGAEIIIGSDTSIQDRCTITGKVQIGRNCIFSKDVLIAVGKHHFENQPHLTIRDQDSIQASKQVFIDPVTIEDDCFIGSGVHIKHGVTLAKGTVVGANAVVAHNFPPYSVIAGVPAKLIRKRLDYNPVYALSVFDELTYPYFYSGLNMQLQYLREDIDLHGGVSTDCLFSLDLKASCGDYVVLKIRKKYTDTLFVVFCGKQTELSDILTEYKFLVEYKSEKGRLDFSIIDQDGKMRDGAAALQSARVCQMEV